jgi:tRNA(Ile)-lysidine synthase
VLQPRVAVAVSGGRDSTALLHCTARQARDLGLEVWALHVHHGLMPEADTWLAQVQQQSLRWGAFFDCRRLAGAPARGESVEAWARAGRYQALAEMAQQHGCNVVLLAHHRRDQAETWLLQALRGAGAAGLASMPQSAQRAGLHWVRPWLNRDARGIDAYVRRHRLKFVQDPSNADPRFARSRLRQAVWPALLTGFADAEVNLAAAAGLAQAALALAREAAQADLSVLVEGGQLLCDPWWQLPPARRRNALRGWLAEQCESPPPQTLLERVISELPSAPTGSWPAPGGMLRLHRGRLAFLAADRLPSTQGVAVHSLDLAQPGFYALPEWGGGFEVQPARTGGVSPAHLMGLLARARQGGERFRARADGPSRTLKQHFQAVRTPSWRRHGPLLFSPQGSLVFVPGLGLDAAFQAPPGTEQLQLAWRPAQAD